MGENEEKILHNKKNRHPPEPVSQINFIKTFLVILFFISPPSVYAGKLDDFEKAATSQTKEGSEKSESEDSIQLTGKTGTDYSPVEIMRAIHEAGMEDTFNRDRGEPTLNLFRLSVNYQYINSDLHGLDGIILLGYGAYAVQYRRTYYSEIKPDDHMNVDQLHFLLRLSRREKSDIALGVGALNLKGNSNHSGFSLTIPISLYFGSIGFLARPTWSWVGSSTINDYDLSMSWGKRFLAIQAGYRWQSANDESLSGPYSGISFYY